jgi:hypothetical protein
MGLRNGISLGIRRRKIRTVDKFGCVEGVRPGVDVSLAKDFSPYTGFWNPSLLSI